MIPTIGVRIGFYICFRALDVFCRPKREGGKFMAVMAVLLILATVFLMIDLMSSSSNLTPRL
jgi:hypothetical protein